MSRKVSRSSEAQRLRLTIDESVYTSAREILSSLEMTSVDERDSPYSLEIQEETAASAGDVIIGADELSDEDMFQCVDCRANDVLDIEGFVTCRHCGRIITRKLDLTAEYHYYGNDDGKSSDPSRCGLPTNHLLPMSSLGTVMVGSAKSYTMRKAKQHHAYNSMPSRERDLYKVFADITLRAVSNGIPQSIIEEAKEIYKHLAETQVFRGSNRKGLIASCIYYACKNKHVPRSAKEIAEIFNIDVGIMTRGCKNMAEIMGDTVKLELDTSRSSDYIGRYSSILSINDSFYVELAKIISERIDAYGISPENTPPSMAASIIYLVDQVFKLGIPIKDVSTACGTSAVTISKCYRVLMEHIDLIIPKKILEHPEVKENIDRLRETTK
jgi:transcription initiation factor TFIIB